MVKPDAIPFCFAGWTGSISDRKLDLEFVIVMLAPVSITICDSFGVNGVRRPSQAASHAIVLSRNARATGRDMVL